MKMKYQLVRGGKGYLEGGQSIFCDITKEIELPILLPEEVDHAGCEVIARVIDGRGRVHDIPCGERDSEYVLSLPRCMLCPQILQISVHVTKGGEILASFDLQPLRVTSFDESVRLQRVIEPEQLAYAQKEIPQIYTAIYDMQNTIATLIEADMQKDSLLKKYKERAEKQQEQISMLAQTLQQMVRQVSLIENKYSIIETIGGE